MNSTAAKTALPNRLIKSEKDWFFMPGSSIQTTAG